MNIAIQLIVLVLFTAAEVNYGLGIEWKNALRSSQN